MAGRRGIGELEEQVMTYLWAIGDRATASEVHQAVASELAYTTVMTVLARLWKKELLTRERLGRAFAYKAAEPEAAHRAEQMRSAFNDAPDPIAVLSSFVDSLDADDVSALRRILDTEES